MSYSVNKTSITLTRGDTLKIQISIFKPDGDPYIPEPEDVIRFAMKKNYDDPNPLILKIIPNDTLILTLDTQDTKPLEFGKYVYDIQLTNGSGEVDTFITKAQFILTEEVE